MSAATSQYRDAIRDSGTRDKYEEKSSKVDLQIPVRGGL